MKEKIQTIKKITRGGSNFGLAIFLLLPKIKINSNKIIKKLRVLITGICGKTN
jgi:hypothetical protein